MTGLSKVYEDRFYYTIDMLPKHYVVMLNITM